MDFLSVLAPEALASEDESASEALASEAGSPCWDVTAAILGEIQAEADAHRVPVIFLLVPWHFPVLDDRLVRHV